MWMLVQHGKLVEQLERNNGVNAELKLIEADRRKNGRLSCVTLNIMSLREGFQENVTVGKSKGRRHSCTTGCRSN